MRLPWVALLALGCSWTLPDPVRAPDASMQDRSITNDLPEVTPADAPRADLPVVTPRDVATPIDLVSPPVDAVAPRDVVDVFDVAARDAVSAADLVVADVHDAPVVTDVAAAQDVVTTECLPGARRTCYTGPMGTRGVGVCRDGIQTCQPEGRWATSCEGQVLPFCTGRLCGTDGCGGTCGVCTGGTRCDDSGLCVAPVCGGGNFTITCPDATRCPRDSHCATGGRCECDEGFVAESCAGTACGGCAFPNWWCRRAFFCGSGTITCPGGYLCPLRSRCDVATRSCDCEPGFVAVDCNGARCTGCPGVSYRCAAL